MGKKSSAGSYRIVPILQIIFGFMLVPFFGLMLLAYFAVLGETSLDTPPYILWIVFILLAVPFGLGIWLFVQGGRNTKLLRAYNRYAPLLAELPVGWIGDLAKMVGEPTDRVRTNLEAMLKRGFFPGATMNADRTQLILSQAEEAEPVPPEERVLVICPHCGGHNMVVPGERITCDYCDCEVE